MLLTLQPLLDNGWFKQLGVAGVIRNADGTAYLGGATVAVFRDSDGVQVATTTSSLVDGSYAFQPLNETLTYTVWARADVTVASMARTAGIDDYTSDLVGVAFAITPSAATVVDAIALRWHRNGNGAYRVGLASSFAVGQAVATIPWLSYKDMPQHTAGAGYETATLPTSVKLTAGTTYMLVVTGHTGGLRQNYGGTSQLTGLTSVGGTWLYVGFGGGSSFDGFLTDILPQFSLIGFQKDISRRALAPV